MSCVYVCVCVCVSAGNSFDNSFLGGRAPCVCACFVVFWGVSTQGWMGLFHDDAGARAVRRYHTFCLSFTPASMQTAMRLN